jgi:hypothetical protein
MKFLIHSLVAAVCFAGTAARADATAIPHATGQLHLVFNERSPLGSVGELRNRRADFESFFVQQNPQQAAYDPAAASYEALVPPVYSRGSAYGLFVWINPGGAQVPPGWAAPLARHRLIFISPNGYFNAPALMQTGMPLDAVQNMTRLYNIDPPRVYIAGHSGGGLAASRMLHSFPDVFRGAFLMNGEDFYLGHHSEAGVLEPTASATPRWRGPLDYEQLKRDLHIVILTGERDTIFEPEISRMNYRGLLMDGFERVTFFEIPQGGHVLPDASWFERGLEALDAPELKRPPATEPTSDPHPSADQLAQATRLLATAQEIIDGDNGWIPPEREFAKHCLQRLIEDYPTTPAAATARELADWIDRHGKELKPPPPSPLLRSALRATSGKSRGDR